MKIAVDLSFLKPDHTNGGTEAVIRNLMKGWCELELAQEFVFFVHRDVYEEYQKLFPECVFEVYTIKGSHKLRTVIFQTFLLPQIIKKHQPDLLFYPSYVTGYHRRLSIPVVVTPHDIQFKFYPHYFSGFKRAYLQIGYSHALRMADQIVAISDYVKGTLLQYFPKECGDKVITIYNPIHFNDKEEGKTHQTIEGICPPIILSVSSIAVHKNMITLIKAYEKIQKNIPYQLVIVGCKGNGMAEINEYLENHDLKGRVIFTDYVNGPQLEWLYDKTVLYVTTSLYEGFGMTPVEAIGRGIPTVSSTSTSLKEVTMNMAEYYEPAENEEILADKMMEMMKKIKQHPEEMKREYRDKGKILRERYREDIIAGQYYQLFKRLVS